MFNKAIFDYWLKLPPQDERRIWGAPFSGVFYSSKYRADCEDSYFYFWTFQRATYIFLWLCPIMYALSSFDYIATLYAVGRSYLFFIAYCFLENALVFFYNKIKLPEDVHWYADKKVESSPLTRLACLPLFLGILIVAGILLGEARDMRHFVFAVFNQASMDYFVVPFLLFTVFTLSASLSLVTSIDVIKSYTNHRNTTKGA